MMQRSERVGPFARVFLAVATLAFVHDAPAAQPQRQSQADAIFSRAVAAADSDAKAPYATYTVVVTLTNDGNRTVSSWSTVEDLAHGIVMPSSFSNEERANPTTPHGINVVAHRRFQLSAPRSFSAGLDPAANLSMNSAPVNPERSSDAVGPVALAADQNYGLTRPREYRIANDQRTVVDGADELTTIGSTGALTQRYRVQLLDLTGGIAHLALTPLRDAYHNRLREVWIDTDTADMNEAVIAGLGDRPPFDSVPWHVTFDRVQGGTYVQEADAVDPVKIGNEKLGISIAFQKLALLGTSPVSTNFGIEAPVRYLRDP
jgi:hypothetical protein